MPKNHNYELEQQVLQYIKTQSMMNNGEPFEASYAKIAEGVGKEGKPELIYGYINDLERNGHIKVIRGYKSKSNQYVFVSDKIVNHELVEFKEQTIQNINDIIQGFNQHVRQLLQVVESLTLEVVAAKGELQPYKEAFQNLKFWSKAPDGSSLFYSDKGDSPALRALIKNSNYH